MSYPNEPCPGLWVELDPGFGYCSLGDDCGNPVRTAHEERFAEWLDDPHETDS
jgi:hypothetical protein